MGELSLKGYEIRSVLGRGGNGVVYEAYDPKSKAIVALKAIDAGAAENVYRLKQEFRALADVQHENLVRFGELAFEEGQWFFTMELVRGASFLDYVRPPVGEASRPADATPEWHSTVLRFFAADSGVVHKAPDKEAPSVGPTLDEGRLRHALGQLASALHALHEAGHIHRDVKPSNILVSNEGRLVLLDFGLVAALTGRGAVSEHGMVGTAAYMAPEQAEGEAVGPAADWYAVGVTLFLALTGQLPFEGAPFAIVEAKLTREAPSPRALAPNAPADLVTLCQDLLRMDPAARPTGSQVLGRLGLAATSLKLPKAVAAHAGAPFVGREPELATLEGALADAASGTPRIVVVLGEPGVGKSALVHRFLTGVSERALVLTGRCYEQETVPFKGMDSVIDALSEVLLRATHEEVTALLGGGIRYLAAVFPVLRRVPAIDESLAGRGGVDNESALREQAFGELERLVVALAKRRPLVVFMDDLQWADKDSLALLHRVLLGARPACLFVATMRTGMDVPRGVAELAAAGSTLSLGALADDEASALWDALWDSAAASPAAGAQRAQCMREAGGHPLFLAELARTARAGRLGDPSGARLPDVLWQRVCERDPVERPFLEMVALAGAPTPYEVLAQAAKVDVGECLTRLGSLRAAQLVRVTRRGDQRLVEPYHDRVREAVVSHLARDGSGTASLAERHLRLGRALRSGTSTEELPARVFAILQHLEAGRALLTSRAERLEVAELHLMASRRARLATAYERAREHAARGLELVGEGGWKEAFALARDLHVERLQAEYLSGEPDAARRTFEAARRHLVTPEDKTALYIPWIALETANGRCVEAIQAGRDVLAELGVPLPKRVSMAHVLTRYLATRAAQGRLSNEEIVALPTLRDPALAGAMAILVSLAPAAFFLDSNLLTWQMLRIAQLSLRHGVCDASSYGFVGYGIVLSGAFHKYEDAASMGKVALALNERFRNGSLAGKVHNIVGGYIASWTRPFAEAIAYLRTAYEQSLKYGDTAYESYSATVISVVSTCESSSLADLDTTAVWAREVGARRREHDMAATADIHVRYSAVLRGLTASATDLGKPGSPDAELAATLTDKTTPVALFHYNFWRAELAYLAGDMGAADAFLREAGKRVQVIFSVAVTVELCFLELLVAARRCEKASFVERLRLTRSIKARLGKLRMWAKSCPVNFEPHYLLAAAELAAVQGPAAEATRRFDEAIAGARRHRSVKREALALERAAAHATSVGDAPRAAALRAQAAGAYRRWGATIKADALERLAHEGAAKA